MLRASSLGLSLPLPTIFAIQQCRRLCGARSRWDPLRSSLRNNCNTTKPPATHIFHRPHLHEPDTSEKSHTLPIEPPLQTIERSTNASQVSLEFVEEETDMYVSPGLTTRQIPSEPDHIGILERMLDPAQESTSSVLEARRDHNEEEVGLGHSDNGIVPPDRHVMGRLEPSQGPVKPVYLPRSGMSVLKRFRRANPNYPDHLLHNNNNDAHGNIKVVSLPSDVELWMKIDIIGQSYLTDEAWDAFVYAVDTIGQDTVLQEKVMQHIPFSHLHRFCRLLSCNRPKTHRQFLRLLSVMTYIRHCGGDLQQFEYNALIDHAGKGWRRTHKEDLAQALRVFNDLMEGRMHGMSEHLPMQYQELSGTGFKPDVYTMTSLISLAARAGDGTTMRGLSNLMTKFELKSNRITHLAKLTYFVDKGDISGVRSVLQKMRQQGMDIGIDGLNACIIAYSRFDRWEVSMMIYRLLRHNMIPETYESQDGINDDIAQLGEEFIFVEPDLIPDEITYSSIIQVMSYHGHFGVVIEAFIDLLSSPNKDKNPSNSKGTEPNPYTPNLAIYRAIFLGFRKFGIPSLDGVHSEDLDWTYSNLRDIFDRFLTLPSDTFISQGNIWIIMGAFRETTNFDLESMQYAWMAIHDRFETPRLKELSDSRVVRLNKQLFPQDAASTGWR